MNQGFSGVYGEVIYESGIAEVPLISPQYKCL